MKRRMFAVLAFGAGVLMLTATANSQPPGGRGEGKGGPGGRGGPGGAMKFELGTILPQFVKADLKLTADQEKEIAAIEADVKAKLNKILTDDQKKILESPPRSRGGFGPGGPGGPGGKGKGGPGGEKKPPQPPQ